DGGTFLAQGQGPFTASDRWGDYSAVAIDPVDDKSFWIFNQHATSSNSWATTVGGYQVPPPPGPPLTDVPVARMGDFNADVRTDLVWRRGSDGQTVLWEMNGGQKLLDVNLNKISTD